MWICLGTSGHVEWTIVRALMMLILILVLHYHSHITTHVHLRIYASKHDFLFGRTIILRNVVASMLEKANITIMMTSFTENDICIILATILYNDRWSNRWINIHLNVISLSILLLCHAIGISCEHCRCDWVACCLLGDCTWSHRHHNIAHDDVIKWKHFPSYWPFVRGIHRSPVNSPHKGQWRGALIFFYLRLNKRLNK